MNRPPIEDWLRLSKGVRAHSIRADRLCELCEYTLHLEKTARQESVGIALEIRLAVLDALDADVYDDEISIYAGSRRASHFQKKIVDRLLFINHIADIFSRSPVPVMHEISKELFINNHPLDH